MTAPYRFKQFTRRHQEIATEVLSYSRHVQMWCAGEAKAYGIEPGTPEYEKFVEEKSKKYAKKLLKQ